jgi:hypothetical protein
MKIGNGIIATVFWEAKRTTLLSLQIVRRVAAQREENALLIRLRNLERHAQVQNEMAALQASIARLEAETQKRAAAIAAKAQPAVAAAVAPAPLSASKKTGASPGASPPVTKPSPGKRKVSHHLLGIHFFKHPAPVIKPSLRKIRVGRRMPFLMLL